MTKFLISKCREHGIPIYAYIDIDEDEHYKRKQKITELSDVMYNIIDGMDGFFISVYCSSINDDNILDFDTHCKLLTDFSEYYKSVQEDKESISEVNR